MEEVLNQEIKIQESQIWGTVWRLNAGHKHRKRLLRRGTKDRESRKVSTKYIQ